MSSKGTKGSALTAFGLGGDNETILSLDDDDDDEEAESRFRNGGTKRCTAMLRKYGCLLETVVERNGAPWERVIVVGEGW